MKNKFMLALVWLNVFNTGCELANGWKIWASISVLMFWLCLLSFCSANGKIFK